MVWMVWKAYLVVFELKLTHKWLAEMPDSISINHSSHGSLVSLNWTFRTELSQH